ncbi:MAG: SprT family zinc-dependent metalloprotease [bacterium]
MITRSTADEIAYNVRISTRARRCRIEVGVTGVTLVVPRRMPVAQAESFLHQNLAWIRTRVEQTSKGLPALPPGTILYRGEKLAAPVPGKSLEKWLRRQARSLVPAEVKAQAARMNLHPKGVTMRSQRTRWGSCSVRGHISLNWRLVMAPPEVLSYVVIHELAHLAEHNHGPGFWSLVATFCPDFRLHKKWLKQHAHLLHRLPHGV